MHTEDKKHISLQNAHFSPSHILPNPVFAIHCKGAVPHWQVTWMLSALG